MLNALLWDVRAQRLCIDENQSHGVDCLCGTPKWQMIKASVEKQSLVVDDQSMVCVTSFVYNVNSRASHLGMSQKRESDCRESTTFLSS